MEFSCRCHSTTGGITSSTLLPFGLWAPDVTRQDAIFNTRLPPGVPPGPEAFRYSCSNNTYTERTDIVNYKERAFLSVTEVAHTR